MELEYRLKLKDYQEAYYINNYKDLNILILGTIYFVIRVIIDLSESNLYSGIFGIISVIFCITYAICIRAFLAAKEWKKQFTLHQPINISINSKQIKLASESFNFIGKWSYYYRYKESKNLFLIYSSLRSFHIVPKRAFESPEASKDFGQLLKTKIGKTKINLEELPSFNSNFYPCYFSYQLDFQDCLKAEAEILRSQHLAYISLWICSILLFAISSLIISHNYFTLFGLFIIMIFLSPRADLVADLEEPILSLIGFLSSSLILGFIFFYGLLINPSLGLLNKWETSRKWKYTPSLREPQTIGINETGITTHSPSVELFATWDSYQNYRETKNYFVVYTLYPHLFKIYPKRAFENSQNLEVFRQFLVSKVDTNIGNYN